MSIFLRTAAGVIVAVLLCISLSKSGKDISLILSLMVCCMVIGVGLSYLDSVFGFFDKLQSIGNLDRDKMEIVLKATGIGMIAEITNLLCIDAGYATLGKSIKVLSTSVILWLALPLLETLLDLLDTILGAL